MLMSKVQRDKPQGIAVPCAKQLVNTLLAGASPVTEALFEGLSTSRDPHLIPRCYMRHTCAQNWS